MASANVTYDEKQFICIKEYPIHELKINHPLSYQKHPRKHWTDKIHKQKIHWNNDWILKFKLKD